MSMNEPMNTSNLGSEVLTISEKNDFGVDVVRIAAALETIEQLAVSGEADERQLRHLMSSFSFFAEKLHHINERLSNVKEIEALAS